jgi:outer membrane protein assembly factor BamB
MQSVFVFARNLIILSAILAPTGAWGQKGDDRGLADWSQFRGLDGTATAAGDRQPPIMFDLKQQAAWAVEIPGTGWSSPVYAGNLIWLTTSVSRQASPEAIQAKLKGDPQAGIKTLAANVELRAIAVDGESGKLVHNRLLRTVTDPEPINPMNSYASPTPAISGDRVVCHFGSYGTWCLDAETAKLIWETQYSIEHSVGPGSSPVIFDNKVILVCDGMDRQFIAAVDLMTGKEVWKTNRPPIRARDGEQRKAYCTPILITVADQQQLVIPGSQWIAAYRLDDGQELWRADHGAGFSVTPMAAYESGLVVFATGYMRADFVAVDPTGTGDVTDTHIKWRIPGAPTMSSFVAAAGRLYAVNNKGILHCIDVKSGEVLNRKRLRGNFSSSPLLAAGNLYLGNREGVMYVVSCSAELNTIASEQLDNSIMASPMLIEDDFVVRTDKRLIRIKPE